MLTNSRLLPNYTDEKYSTIVPYFSGSGDMKIMQWDLDTKKKIKSLDGHNGDIAALSLKPQDNQV